jgi:hypothetical protein
MFQDLVNPEGSYLTPDSPLAVFIGILIIVALLAAFFEALEDTVKTMGLARAALFWIWQLAVLPLLIWGPRYLGWWMILAGFVWVLITANFFTATKDADEDQKPPR